jgi:aminoacyl tRNA synthase complex-interacting multifunctional protein 1
LLEQAGQVDVAFAAHKEGSEERKTVEKWIEAATSGQDLPLKELDEHLKNKTYIAGSKLTAADIAVFGAVNTHVVGDILPLQRMQWLMLLSRQAQSSHDVRLSHANVTRHFDLLQHTPLVTSAASKVSPNLVSHEPVSIDLNNVPLVERKYESAKKDKKPKAAEVATGKDAAAGTTVEGAQPAVVKEAAEASIAAAEGAPVPAQGKKEKKAKKEPAAGAEGAEAGKPKKEKAAGGGGGGKNAEPEPITPGLIDMRVGRIVEGQFWSRLNHDDRN